MVSRERAIETLQSDRFDLAVIGGGITGAGVALDAAVLFSARREQARTVADVLLRRTRLGLPAAREICVPDSRVPAYVAEALARELGWDSRRVRAELERFAQEAAAEGICAE
jgi:glycerol-3-phosphate dehydrogenase